MSRNVFVCLIEPDAPVICYFVFLFVLFVVVFVYLFVIVACLLAVAVEICKISQNNVVVVFTKQSQVVIEDATVIV